MQNKLHIDDAAKIVRAARWFFSAASMLQPGKKAAISTTSTSDTMVALSEIQLFWARSMDS